MDSKDRRVGEFEGKKRRKKSEKEKKKTAAEMIKINKIKEVKSVQWR